MAVADNYDLLTGTGSGETVTVAIPWAIVSAADEHWSLYV